MGFDWASDNATIIYKTQDPNNRRMTINLFNLESQTLTPLVQRSFLGEFDLSPDGLYVAYIAASRRNPPQLCFLEIANLNEWCSETTPYVSSTVRWSN